MPATIVIPKEIVIIAVSGTGDESLTKGIVVTGITIPGSFNSTLNLPTFTADPSVEILSVVVTTNDEIYDPITNTTSPSIGTTPTSCCGSSHATMLDHIYIKEPDVLDGNMTNESMLEWIIDKASQPIAAAPLTY